MDRAVAWTHTRPRVRHCAIAAGIRDPERRYYAYGASVRRAAAQQLLLRRCSGRADNAPTLSGDLRRYPYYGHPWPFSDTDRRLDTLTFGIVPFSLRSASLKGLASGRKKIV